MKLYSYHSQVGDDVVFITEEYQLTGKHDKLYLLRELRHTPIPTGDILDDYRTVLIGKEFEMFEDATDIDNKVAICRPDYSLYHYDEPSMYDRASFVQFFNQNSLLKNIQDWHRSDSRYTVVVDRNFWDASPQIIVGCLNTLIGEGNVVFMYPIKIKKLMNDDVFEAFCQLKLAKKCKIEYNNNIGDDYNSIVAIIDMMKKLKRNFIYLNISSIPVKIITTDHWAKKSNIYYDFERCLKIMTYAQKQRIRINFRYPKMRLSSPSWHYFEFFKTWSNHYHTLPYIEALLKGSTNFYKISYAAILNNQLVWTTAKIKQAVHLIARYTDLMKEYGFSGWGGVYSTTADLIDYHYVKEKAVENSLF